MIERIKSALKDCGIALWRINDNTEESAELFFVKKQLDTRRFKDVRKFQVTVFRDVDKDGAFLRGFTSVTLLESMNDSQLREELKGAYYAAQFAANPAYELPDPVQAPIKEKPGELCQAPLAESAGKMARALFSADSQSDAFINSAEIFIIRSKRHILSSEGTDVSYTDGKVTGEFVAQCREPEDVEIHNMFSYDSLNTEALGRKVKEALSFVRDRARAKRILKSGKYDVVLSGDAVASVLSYYDSRSSAHMIYPKYSTWQAGDSVQGEDVPGARLNLDLCATVPYSEEGIPMEDLPLLREGKLQAIHGNNRFCRYLGIKPTGMYGKLRCTNTGASFEELKSGPCLWAVTFSGFEMNAMSGHFGGEIRLAYLIDGGTVTPVTGGSINGSLLDAQGNLQFSSDRYEAANYSGPYGLRINGVSVAGTDD